MKKLLSIALALTMCLSLTIPAFATEATVTEVAPCKYDSVRDFSEGMAAVAIKDAEGNYKWGFIDKTGKEIVPCKYDNWYYGSRNEGKLPDFSEGLAPVCVITDRSVYNDNRFHDCKGTWGFIDKSGNEVIPLQYDIVGAFSDGLAKVAIKDGIKTVTPWTVSYDCTYGYIDKTGKVVIPLQYSYAGDFSEGLAAVEDKNGTWHYIDKMGKAVICDLQYSRVSSFSDGMAAVALDDIEGKKTWWGFIDKAGNEVIPCQYERVNAFSEGLASVYTGKYPDGKKVFIDKTGKVALSPEREGYNNNNRLYSFSEGLAMVSGVEGWGDEERYGYGFIDKTGKVVISLQYNAGVENFSEGLAKVNRGGKYGYIDKTGNEVVPCSKRWWDVCSVYEGMAAVCKKDADGSIKWGFISISDASEPKPSGTVSGFSDVKTSDYFAEPVAWAVEKGVTVGTSASTFSPDATCTQGQILTFLWRAKGEPAPVASVSDTAYYAKAAQWAKEQGLTDNFSAEADCTRAMVVTYLWKLAGSPAVGSATFADVPADAPYAQAVAWAVAQGITNGTGNGSFSPDATCTRGQIVTFLYRALAQ